MFISPNIISCSSFTSTREVKIDEINLFLINVTKERNFSYGVWKNRQHVMINIKGGNHIGWGETKVSSNQPDFDMSTWSGQFKKLKGMMLREAIQEVRNQFLAGGWKPTVTEGLLMTLYDLMGKIENRPTVKIWGLSGEAPVPGIFCILEKEETMVVKQAQIAVDQNMHRYVKIKMFGDFELDKKNIIVLRKFLGPDSFIVGDPNRGYDHVKDLQELSEIMITLNEAGMDGVMIGRAAYHQPSDLLAAADQRIFGQDQGADPVTVVQQMLPYIDAHLSSGGKLNQVTRHMLGLFAGQPGARAWRRILSERGHISGTELVEEALGHVIGQAAA